MIRLEKLSRDLVSKLRLASAAKQREASLAACEFAISHAQVDNPQVEKTLKKMHGTSLLTRTEKTEINAIATQLDGEYFDLEEASDEGKASMEEYMRVFAKARAVRAVINAANDDPFRGATESINEAAATIRGDDKGALFTLIEAVLERRLL